MLLLSANGATHQNTGTLDGAPAVSITATGVTFVNTSSSLVSANVAGQPAILLGQGGNTVVNALDAAIAGYGGTGVAIQGSSGQDTIDNAGTIAGTVALGGGNDSYILRHSPSISTTINVDMGAGNDTAELRFTTGLAHIAPVIAGGADFDVLRLNGPVSQVDASGITGFERIEISNSDPSSFYIEALSGFGAISLATGTRVTLAASLNPLVDLSISGGFVTLANGSTVRSVTGGAGDDYLELGFLQTPHTPVTTSIDLGGGDDWLWLTMFNSTQFFPGLPATVKGGAGYDRINLSVPNGQTIDMAQFSGFEEIDTGTFTSATSYLRLINLEAFQVVKADTEGSLTIAQTVASGLTVTPLMNSTIVIENTATIGAVGYVSVFGSAWLDTPVAQFGQSVTVTNGGTVTGNVQLALGNDVYNGSAGTVGGAVYGYAGNDTLTGGAAADRLFGGYGADILVGGGGADRLDGGAGSDSLTGGSGNDTFAFDQRGIGDDIITDFTAGDRIDLSALGIADFATLQRYMTQVGGDTVIRLGYASASETITIKNVALASLGAGDFVFNTSAAGRSETATTGDDLLFGGPGADVLNGGAGGDLLTGGLGNDSIDGGAGVDTAVFAGNRSAYTVTAAGFGLQVTGPDGTDTLVGVEYARFTDQTIRLYPGQGTTVNFATDNPATYMTAIRDFDGNDVGSNTGWKLIGSADVNGDGDVDQVFVNKAAGRFAEVGTAPDGKVYFSDYSWAGETRVVGIYIDPLVQSGQVVAGSDHDSQRRFQNDLQIDNIKAVLGSGDYDHNGLQEVYFSLTDGTAFLHAYMHADGNIQYANYQSQAQVTAYLQANGWASSTYAGWFG